MPHVPYVYAAGHGAGYYRGVGCGRGGGWGADRRVLRGGGGEAQSASQAGQVGGEAGGARGASSWGGCVMNSVYVCGGGMCVCGGGGGNVEPIS